ncbi:hypothetical protein OUZ56_033378 [Daphnia magna]|uniref:Uncharacterized protein n=1 Tax=Daphnia magna TaxID=35525 RepID=A0ABQ9ZXZ6_9CRUS|nr:hypothetical protein OUZ56_033378 [Daphnia magna]
MLKSLLTFNHRLISSPVEGKPHIINRLMKRNRSGTDEGGMEDDLPYGRQMRVYHKVRNSRRKRKITTKMEGRFPIGFYY